jgi:hypothetical protein
MASMRLATFPTMIFLGASNGSAAQLPVGETNPLSPQSRASQIKKTVKIGVGLLPYIAIASVWRRKRPVVTDLTACRYQLTIDTSSCRTVGLEDLTSSTNAIPRSSYLFRASWRHVRRTLLVAVEQGDDPFAVVAIQGSRLGQHNQQ